MRSKCAKTSLAEGLFELKLQSRATFEHGRNVSLLRILRRHDHTGTIGSYLQEVARLFDSRGGKHQVLSEGRSRFNTTSESALPIVGLWWLAVKYLSGVASDAYGLGVARDLQKTLGAYEAVYRSFMHSFAS